MLLKIKPPHHRGEGENNKVMQKNKINSRSVCFPATGDRVYLLVEKFEILESIILGEVVYNELVG